MPQPKSKPTGAPAPGSTPSAAQTDESTPQPSSQQPPAAAAPTDTKTPKTATITLKPTRPSLPTHTLPSPLPLATTSIHDLKAAYIAAAALSGVPTTKIKILYAKKPLGDTKTVGEVLPADVLHGDVSVEFSVMVLGGGGGVATPTAGTPERVASPAVGVPEPSETPAAAVGGGVTQTEVEMGEAPAAPAPSEAGEVLRTEEFWADLKGFLVGRLKDEGEGERLAAVFREAWGKGSGSS